MDELKPSEISRLIESLRLEATFQADRFGRRILADELREAADALEKLRYRSALQNTPVAISEKTPVTFFTIPLTEKEIRESDGKKVWILEAFDAMKWLQGKEANFQPGIVKLKQHKFRDKFENVESRKGEDVIEFETGENKHMCTYVHQYGHDFIAYENKPEDVITGRKYTE